MKYSIFNNKLYSSNLLPFDCSFVGEVGSLFSSELFLTE